LLNATVDDIGRDLSRILARCADGACAAAIEVSLNSKSCV
jgi:hypothetical protein